MTLSNNARLIIYCAAGYGEEIYIKLRCIEKDILCFCDNAKRLEGKSVLGKPVYSYDICRKSFPYATYIIANANYLKSILIGKELELVHRRINFRVKYRLFSYHMA